MTMKSGLLLTAVLALGACEAKAPPAAAATAPAAAPLTNFEAYPVEVFTGPAVMPAYTGDQRPFAEYRTRIGEAVKHGANFAGHYAVAEVGCGTGCRYGYLTDLKTGRILEAPVGGARTGSVEMAYRPNSSLFVARWPSDDWKSCIWQTFEMKAGAFSKVRDANTSGECPELNPDPEEKAESPD